MWKARPCPLLIAHTYDVVGMSAAVKDVRRFEDKETGLLQPHEQRHTGTLLEGLAGLTSAGTANNRNGAVDNTFVQFYPTLRTIAAEKGTYKEPGAGR